MVKTKRIIFNLLKIPCVCATVMACALLVSPVVAATNNGCEKDENEYISPEIALCSVHAYNINHTINPSTEAKKQAMKEVVALKTTIMTQQMYKQYEYLDAMMRRFKTQLKKAVLTTSLQAAGAEAENSSSGTANSTDKRIVLAGTQNCMLSATSPVNAAACLQSNVQTVVNAINAGNITDAKKQLRQDLEVAETWQIIDASKNLYDKNNALASCSTIKSSSTGTGGTSRREEVLDCAQKFLVQIATYNYQQQQAAQRQNNKIP